MKSLYFKFFTMLFTCSFLMGAHRILVVKQAWQTLNQAFLLGDSVSPSDNFEQNWKLFQMNASFSQDEKEFITACLKTLLEKNIEDLLYKKNNYQEFECQDLENINQEPLFDYTSSALSGLEQNYSVIYPHSESIKEHVLKTLRGEHCSCPDNASKEYRISYSADVFKAFYYASSLKTSPSHLLPALECSLKNMPLEEKEFVMDALNVDFHETARYFITHPLNPSEPEENLTPREIEDEIQAIKRAYAYINKTSSSS